MNKKWIEITLNILFWIFSSWLIIFSFSITEHVVDISDGIVTGDTKHSNGLIIFFSVGQPLFALYFYVQYFITQQLTKRSKLKNILLRLSITMFIYLGSYVVLVKLFFTEFVHVIWFPSLWYGVFIFYTVVAIAYGLIKVWSKMEMDKSRLELMKNQSELNLLRSQLHPHFLFNTMNNLLSMVDQVKNPKLANSIDKLSSLLRYVVYEKNDRVEVYKEIQFIQNFSELHLLRFEDGEIDYKLNIIGYNDEQLIEIGILLSLVENAFKHGVQLEYNSFIYINIDITKPAEFIFNIKNSIPPYIKTDNNGGFGLKSTKERLQLAYPNKHNFTIEKTQQYFNVTLKINTHESNNSR